MSARRPSRALLLGAALALLAACGRTAPGGAKHFRYAEAAQVPVAVVQRDQLASLLAGFAQRNGLYYRDSTPRAQRTSNGKQTLAIAMERQVTSGRPWAEIAVSALGDGPALITFVTPLDRGVAPDSDRQRAQLMADIRGKWPATAEVPLLPDGGIARQEDLRFTPQGLRIDRAKAADYKLPTTSPLLTP
jgi:hypothetical protein